MRTYQKSFELFEESGKVLAGGVASSLRAAMKPVPLFAKSGSGPRVRDVDGNEYIDYLLAYGPLILGHAHPALTESARRAMENGAAYGLQHEGEIRLAKRLTELLPCAERVALSGSGTEAVMLALRLARAATGKAKVVRFHGHYHGWSDGIFTSFPGAGLAGSGGAAAGGGSAGAGGGEAEAVLPGTAGQSELSLQDVILLPWNDIAAVRETLRARAHEIAAVITEPVMCNSGCIVPKPGYLEELRALTKELGIVLIFDEVITGFRLSLGGAQERFGVVPDLVTVGKALAGGVALSAVGGKRELMDLIASGRVNHLGTLNGNCLATEAALAVLDELAKDGAAALKRMESLAVRLADGLRRLMQKHGLRGVVNQIGAVFHMMFIDRDEVTTFAEFSERDAGLYARFAERMLAEGVLLRPNGLWYLSAAHTDAEIGETLAAADRALAAIAQEAAG